jgi:hypothetical protein
MLLLSHGTGQGAERDRLDAHLSRIQPAQMRIDPVVRLASRLEFRDERCRLGALVTWALSVTLAVNLAVPAVS